MKTLNQTIEGSTGTLINFQDWTLPSEIKAFIGSTKRTFEPIRDLLICYLMIFSVWMADITNPIWWMHI